MTTPIRILLIDDQPITAAAMRKLLAAAPDMTMSHCADPMKAVAEVERLTPSVMIVDMVMPVVSGLEVIQQVRTNPGTATLPIILMSSIDEPEAKALALDTGADEYLVKLPDGRELISRVRALLRRAGWSKNEQG